ncbi:hypothetical protein HYV88_04790 [Candidatus Woesearchaeota archaeon]|nr:hypothetical protein [Candidatus Woesearchaeota archaeon]
MAEYSQALCQYLGQIELKASQSGDSFARYLCFYDALDSLACKGLSEEDSRLARDILRNRARETKPWNIGSASGEAGEAD